MLRLWVEHASDIAEEYYASFTLDRPAKLHLCMVSAKGGVDIEEVAETDPGAIVRMHVEPGGRHRPRRRFEDRGRSRTQPEAASRRPRCSSSSTSATSKGDCDLAEINPLVLTPDGKVHALDAKVSLDDNAAFRHPEWDEFAGTEVLDEREQLARRRASTTSGSTGTVGIIANGAGLAMSTLDVVTQVGGTAANFLDIGGGANADVMAAALEVINSDREVRAIFVNIFGGITQRRRGGQRHPRSAQQGEDPRTDSSTPRRHQRGGGTRDPRAPPLADSRGRTDNARWGPPGRRPGRGLA